MKRKRGLAEQVYQQLRARILNFVYLPGHKLSDDELSSELGVSRTPVREALNRLCEQGLVVSQPNRGFWVKTFTRQEVEDLFILRETLELLALDLAMQDFDSDKAKQLEAILSTYPDLMESRDLARLNDVDGEFHDCIARISGNAELYETMKRLSGKIRIIRRYEHLRPTSFKETYEEHSEILRQMKAGDAAAARRAMSKHIRDSMREILKILPD